MSVKEDAIKSAVMAVVTIAIGAVTATGPIVSTAAALTAVTASELIKRRDDDAT